MPAPKRYAETKKRGTDAVSRSANARSWDQGHETDRVGNKPIRGRLHGRAMLSPDAFGQLILGQLWSEPVPPTNKNFSRED